MKIIINNTSMIPIYEQIVEQIKALIINGELKENDILPSWIPTTESTGRSTASRQKKAPSP